jgi:2,3-bisphosphoglycerate-dependent phosphoglycerate mutase
MGDLQGQAVQLKRKWVPTANSTVETVTSFIERNVSWWNKTILDGIVSQPPKSDPYHILVTAHGGVISTMLRSLVRKGQLKCAPGVTIGLCANTSVTIIDVDQDRLGAVTKYGDVSHIREDGREIETNADEVEVSKY